MPDFRYSRFANDEPTKLPTLTRPRDLPRTGEIRAG